jgi:predicted GNAT family N-acyltransferase
LKHIIEESIKQRVKNLWCNARLSALGFYQKFGFEAISETWMDNEIEYVKMEKIL